MSPIEVCRTLPRANNGTMAPSEEHLIMLRFPLCVEATLLATHLQLGTVIDNFRFKTLRNRKGAKFLSPEV